MANPPRTRKRVFGLRRAPDGSAFQKCDSCGVLVAMALYDMHDCNLEKEEKRLKREERTQSLGRQRKNVKCKDSNEESAGKERINNQPRSPFCFFMENYKTKHMNENWRDVERRGFETWKSMSQKERCSFIIQSDRVNFDYEQALLAEVDDVSQLDDEADSSMVGKIDPNFWTSSEVSGSSSLQKFKFNSFDSLEWNMGPRAKRV